MPLSAPRLDHGHENVLHGWLDPLQRFTSIPFPAAPRDTRAGGLHIVHRHVQPAAEHGYVEHARDAFRVRAWFRAAPWNPGSAGCEKWAPLQLRRRPQARSPSRGTSEPGGRSIRLRPCSACQRFFFISTGRRYRLPGGSRRRRDRERRLRAPAAWLVQKPRERLDEIKNPSKIIRLHAKSAASRAVAIMVTISALKRTNRTTCQTPTPMRTQLNRPFRNVFSLSPARRNRSGKQVWRGKERSLS